MISLARLQVPRSGARSFGRSSHSHLVLVLSGRGRTRNIHPFPTPCIHACTGTPAPHIHLSIYPRMPGRHPLSPTLLRLVVLATPGLHTAYGLSQSATRVHQTLDNERHRWENSLSEFKLLPFSLSLVPKSFIRSLGSVCTQCVSCICHGWVGS